MFDLSDLLFLCFALLSCFTLLIIYERLFNSLDVEKMYFHTMGMSSEMSRSFGYQLNYYCKTSLRRTLVRFVLNSAGRHFKKNILIIVTILPFRSIQYKEYKISRGSTDRRENNV